VALKKTFYFSRCSKWCPFAFSYACTSRNRFLH